MTEPRCFFFFSTCSLQVHRLAKKKKKNFFFIIPIHFTAECLAAGEANRWKIPQETRQKFSSEERTLQKISSEQYTRQQISSEQRTRQITVPLRNLSTLQPVPLYFSKSAYTTMSTDTTAQPLNHSTVRSCYHHRTESSSPGFPMVTGYDDSRGLFQFNSIYFPSPDCIKAYLISSKQFNLIELHELYCRSTAAASQPTGRCTPESKLTCEFHGGALGSSYLQLLHDDGYSSFCDKHCAKSFLMYRSQMERLHELEGVGTGERIPPGTKIRPQNRTLRYFRRDGLGYGEEEFLATLFLPDDSVGGVLWSGSPLALPINFRDVTAPFDETLNGDVLVHAPFSSDEPGFRSEYI